VRIIVLGLSITSSWGNGHATTYRGLVRALAERGHDVLFLERDRPWYAANRDLPGGADFVELYQSLEALRDRFEEDVRDADLVVVGSFVPDGVAVGEWVVSTARGVTAFYDIDTPVTLAKLERRDHEYLAPELVPRYDLYLSFTGGPTLRRIERAYGARQARALYCAVNPELYRPEPCFTRHDLGYLGTYAADRQPALERLLLEPARRSPDRHFVVAGPEYPQEIEWPPNVERLDHLPPAEHNKFYGTQRFTLNVTRADMVRAGWSPSVRLFEAAACAVPVISDWWDGLDTFFAPGREILVAQSSDETLRYLDLGEDERRAIGDRARRRVLAEHTAERRAEELEGYVRKPAAIRT
jgi:spore maturation protein CgeB